MFIVHVVCVPRWPGSVHGAGGCCRRSSSTEKPHRTVAAAATVHGERDDLAVQSVECVAGLRLGPGLTDRLNWRRLSIRKSAARRGRAIRHAPVAEALSFGGAYLSLAI